MSLLSETPPEIHIPANRLEFATEAPELFDFLLQDIFRVACYEGCTVREFLCILMQVCGDYTEKRIQTIFLNGRPVDDLDAAILHENDRLALSAAMPGLVGATMRRGGFYAKMRGSISYNASQEEEHSRPCLVQVRLFNFLSRELADRFLDAGIFFGTSKLAELLEKQSAAFFDQLHHVTLDGQPVPSSTALVRELCAGHAHQDTFLRRTPSEDTRR